MYTVTAPHWIDHPLLTLSVGLDEKSIALIIVAESHYRIDLMDKMIPKIPGSYKCVFPAHDVRSQCEVAVIPQQQSFRVLDYIVGLISRTQCSNYFPDFFLISSVELERLLPTDSVT